MFKNLIWTKPNSLSADFCQHMIDKFDKSLYKRAGTFGDDTLDKSFKDTTELGVTLNPNWVEEDHVLFDAVQNGLDEYESYLRNIDVQCVPHPFAYFNQQDRGYKIQKYDANSIGYKWHNDFSIESDFGTRVYVFMWYLNSIDKKYGGSTDFFDGTSIQPECGTLVFFPATWTYVHRGRPTKTEKYIVNGWIYHQEVAPSFDIHTQEDTSKAKEITMLT